MSQQTSVRYPSDSVLASEIAQQPALWPTTLQRVLSADISWDLERTPIMVTGAGTSAYAALAIADAWPGARALPTTDLLLKSAAEVKTAMPSFPDGGLLISLARSGDSPESVGVVQRMQALFPQVRHLAIVCNAEGRLAHTAGIQVICLDPRTNDRSLAMTGSFSNLVLGGLCLFHHKLMEAKLPALCNLVSSLLPKWNEAAAEIAHECKDRMIFLTSAMHALALEASIKVIELTAGRVIPMPETFLGLRHGALSFARADTPVICFASSDENKRRYEKELLDDLHAKGLGKFALFAGGDTATWQHDWLVESAAPALADCLRIPFEVPFIQLLAYHLSLHAHINPDDPSPAGIVTRVVKGFRLHDGLATS